ncbi:MAG TPA: glycosyltransferase family 2 protein, partial [Cytophagales bacterium]|nr:glycosyltransferase family 2 protein [Cytophagales bacterium]
TMDIIRAHGKYTVMHEDGRKGKIAAVNRVMHFVKTPITIFCDANTYLNADAVQNIVRHFADPRVGCVAGEKRIFKKKNDTASGAGEGIYWKYESYLKRMDSELQNIVGAAGELFAVRTELFEFLPSSTIIEDFVLSLSITERGYLAKYEPEAYAQESASENIEEELKRKIRICAGGFQAMAILKGLLNPFKHGLLTFQYVSHRVLRWAVVPFLLLAIIPINIYLAVYHPNVLYKVLLAAQALFYVASLLGWYLKNKKMEVKVLFVPYYFFIMNYAAYMGFLRYMKGSQSAVWERAKRSAV